MYWVEVPGNVGSSLYHASPGLTETPDFPVFCNSFRSYQQFISMYRPLSSLVSKVKLSSLSKVWQSKTRISTDPLDSNANCHFNLPLWKWWSQEWLFYSGSWSPSIVLFSLLPFHEDDPTNKNTLFFIRPSLSTSQKLIYSFNQKRTRAILENFSRPRAPTSMLINNMMPWWRALEDPTRLI